MSKWSDVIGSQAVKGSAHQHKLQLSLTLLKPLQCKEFYSIGVENDVNIVEGR